MRTAPNTANDEFGLNLVALEPRLQAYARRLSRDADQADDLVQETMLRAWAARLRFTPGTSMSAWTYTILRNLFLSGTRRRRFEGAYDEQSAELRNAQAAGQQDIVELGFIARQVNQLPPSQARSLRLVAIEGLSYDDAAAHTGLPIGTVKAQVSRARKALSTSSSFEIKLDQIDAVPPASPAVGERATSEGLRNAWAEAKRRGKTLVIG